MKKILLSVLAMGMSLASVAQTNVEIAGNEPTSSGEGFEFLFQNGAFNSNQVNCLNLNGVGVSNHWGDVFGTAQAGASQGVGFHNGVRFNMDDVNDELLMEFDGTQDNIFCRLPVGNCANAGTGLLDMSVDKRIQVFAESSVPATLEVFLVVLNGANFQEVDGDATHLRPSVTFSTGDLKKEFCGNAPTHNWQGTDYTSSFNNVIGFAFKLNSSSTAGTLRIKHLKFGDACNLTAGTTSTTDASALDANLISVYPTPAKDVLNVDLSKIGAADLKLVSSNGQTVYSTSTSNSVELINVESFNKGLYVLQITSNGKTTTKKVVLN
jgi:hypothetical protein